MLDYTITNTALIKLHVHVTKHRGVEVKKCLWGWTFYFHFIFSRADISLLSALFSINSVQLQILYSDCCLDKNQRNFFKAKSSNIRFKDESSDLQYYPQNWQCKCKVWIFSGNCQICSTFYLVVNSPASWPSTSISLPIALSYN